MEKHLSVGCAKVDVTPPLTIPYLGFVPRQAYFTGVHDPLYARAAVIGDGTTELAVICVDALGYSDVLVGRDGGVMEELGARVEAVTGIPAAHVLLSATHAHSTPETCCLTRIEEIPAARPWFESHLDQIASAVAMAAARRRPCRLKAGSIPAPGVAWNRRILGKDGRLYAWHNRPPDDEIADWGANDHELGLWLLEGIDDEEPVCAFVNFACHPTTVQVQPLVSADFPGMAMQILEEHLGGVALFLQGMCGNVRPVSTEHGFRDVRRHGLALAGAALHLAGRLMQRETPSAGWEVRLAYRRVPLPTRRDGPDEGELRARMAEHQRELAAARSEEERRAALARIRWVDDRLRMVELARDWPTMSADLFACRIGEAALVGMAGEPFVEYGLQLKAASPAKHTLTLGYIGNWVGYLPNAEAYERGGYEPSYGAWTRLAPGAGETLTAKAERLLCSLW